MDTIMSTAIMQLLTRIVRSLSERSRATGTAQVSAGAPLATRLMALVAALGLAGAGVAQAQTNDLRIKSSSFQLDINGAPNALAQVAYRKGIDDVHLSLELQMSWECEQEFVPLGGGPIGFWRCKPRPDFELEIELVAIPNVCKTVFCLDDPARHFPIATVPVDGATEIQDRPPPLPEIVIAPLNTTNKKTYEVILTDLPGLHEFAAQLYIDDHYFEIRARAFSDVPNLETNPNNNQARHERDFLPFNGRFAFGPTDTALRTLGTVVENQAVCGLSDVADSNSQPLLQFFSNTTVLWQPSPNALDWPAQVVALDDNPACARPVKQGDGLDLLAETDQIVGDLQAQRGGFDVTLLNNVLDATTGAAPSALQLNLPAGHSYHGDDPVEPGPVPRGSSVMILPVSMSGDDYDTIGSTVNAGWLQSEGLPWSFRIDTLKLDKSAFAGTYGEVHYLHDRFYNPWDRRRLSVDGPTSNDRRFSRPESMANQADPSMLLTPSGLEVPSIAMRGVQRGITHFPRTMVEGWKESVAHVAGGRFEADELGPADQYGFELSTDCASCDSGGSEVDYVLKPEINEGLGTDGAYIVRVNNLENPEWGPFVLELNGVIDNSAPNYVIQLNDGWTYSQSQGFTQVYALYDKRRIFERDGDITKSGVLFYPGGIVRGSAGKTNTRVTDYLLGMRRASDQGGHLRPTTHYALTANQARRGNFFMAGLTVGPEVYSNAAEKQPEVGLGSNLDDTLMTIGFGGTTDPDFQTLGSRVGTKYVARQGGITGAFNFDSLPTPKVYEYKLDLIRFAFRQVNNVLDEYSWIDGEISVPGKGDFQVAFESLNLQCSGDVGKGIVTREQCDNIDNNSIFGIDENCDEVMGAWLAPMELQSL
ncbi:MAG: hypothetical protein KDK91_19440, partial [Gammaproteobacteria bacterium]|nr:hypothetical protein [Gammaproteobacteria bacterium]